MGPLSAERKSGKNGAVDFDATLKELETIWIESHPGAEIPKLKDDAITFVQKDSRVEMKMSDEMLNQLARELRDSSLPATTSVVDGTTTYELPDGPAIQVAPERTVQLGDSNFEPMVGGGGAIITAVTVWLSHNRKCPSTKPRLNFYVNRTGYSHCIR